MINLPFGIDVSVGVSDDGDTTSGVICSDLFNKGVLWEADDTRTHKNRAKGFADGIESLILALACEGVDVHTEEFSIALHSAVDGFVNNN